MAQIVLGAVGAVASTMMGFGPGIGFSLGSMLGSSMTKSPTTRVQGQQQALMDLRVTGTEYGQAIAFLKGAASIAGQVWWNTDRRPTTTTTTTTSGGGGGKGGGGGGSVETSTTTITYDMDLLIGLTDNPIMGVVRIWSNGTLLYTADASADSGSLAASVASNAWTRMTVYTGAADQLPDPTYEAAVGTENACAYRGRGSVFIEGLKLGQSGQVPNLTFEVVGEGSESPGTYATYDPAKTAYDCGGLSSGYLMFSNDVPWGFASMQWSASVGTQFRPVGAGNGSWYCEFNLGGNEAGCGVANDAFVPVFGLPLGGDANSYGIFPVWGGGYFFGMYWAHNGASGPLPIPADSYGQGIFGMEFDAVAGTIHFWQNGVDKGIVFSGLAGSFAPAGMIFSRLGGAHAGVNFGQSPWSYPAHGSPWMIRSGTIAKTPPSVGAVVLALCERAGLSAGEVDVTALSTITRRVRSLAVSQIASTRSTLELLMSVYFFEMVVSDKIYFRPRGGSIVASIPYLDLGADKSDGKAEPLALLQANELEIPAQIALTYININDDYQNDTQYSDRLISAAAGTVSAMQLAIGLTPDEAKAVADTMLHDQAASVVSTKIALLGDYCRLEPTDAVQVTGADGSNFRLRLVKKTDSYPLMQFDAVVDDISVLTSPGVTSDDYISSNIVSLTSYTLMELMDIPILRDADNNAGFYVATKGDLPLSYPGSAVFSSVDDVEYTRRTTVLESAVFGICTSILGDWTLGRIFDETNSVTVNVGDGVLASTTRDALLHDLVVNAMLIGNELIQFRTATLVSAGVYVLSGLLRGGRGTEWAMTGHAAGERSVLLRAAGVRRIVLTNAEIGLPRFYKGITLSRSLSSQVSRSFVDTGVALKPFSPLLLRKARDASNTTIEWQRRSRLAVRMIGAIGISVPLGEAWEKYEIDIFDAGLATLATITTTIPSFEFANTAYPTAVGVQVYQISETVGRGYPLTVVL